MGQTDASGLSEFVYWDLNHTFGLFSLPDHILEALHRVRREQLLTCFNITRAGTFSMTMS
jgi:hypothetical protein